MSRPTFSDAGSWVGILLAVWFGAEMVSSVYSLAAEEPSGLDIAFYGMFICTGLVLIALLFVRREVRLNFHLLVTAVFLPLYVYETWEGWSRSARVFDSRSKYEITMELRQAGIQA